MTGYEGALDRQQILAGWLAATQRGLELYGERRDFSLDDNPMAVSWFMEFDHVIYSWGNGRHAQAVKGLWAPEAVCYRDEHGEWLDPDLEEGVNGWSLMAGYTGQHGMADSPWMHQSEFIGGRMAEDILNTCGFFVAIYPHFDGGLNTDEYTDPDTWAVAYISENIPGSA